MGSDGWVVDFRSNSGEGTFSNQRRVLVWISCRREEIIDVGDLAEMGAQRVDEKELKVDVSFNQVSSGF